MTSKRKSIPIALWGKEYIDFWFPGSEEMATKQIPSIVKLLKITIKSKILDCPCGWGRYSNPLAKLGHKVVGLDSTKRFIEMAKEKAPKDNTPDFIVGDMRKLKIDKEYDVILNLYGSFGYFDRTTDFKVLASFVKGLKRGGQLMIDQANWEKVIRLPKRIWFTLPEGKRCLKEQSVDLIRGTYYFKDTIIDGVEEHFMELTMNWYTVVEYRNLLGKLGIKKFRFYGDFDGSEYTVESNRQIIIAIK